MTVRLPQTLTAPSRRETGVSVLQTELAQQQAQTLGNLGEQLERALARLAAFDRSGKSDPAERGHLLDHAGDRAWALMIQRELCGLRHWEATVKAYGIPREVLNRMGRIVAKP